MTVESRDLAALLPALRGAATSELLISFYDFLAGHFPGIKGGLFEYQSSPAAPVRLAGVLDAADHINDDESALRFKFNAPDSDRIYVLLVQPVHPEHTEGISAYCYCLGHISRLLGEQAGFGRRNCTDTWANVISRISHDLNALIRTGGDTPGELLKIEQKKAVLANALPKLLLYSRPLQLSPVILSFQAFIEAVLDKYGRRTGIAYHPGADLQSVSIACDVELMDLAIHELLDNAFFARDIHGGEIIVAAVHYHSTGPEGPRGWGALEIRNSRASIPDEFLVQVKDPLFTTWSNQGKSGMGLALADYIARSHGGSCKIESSAREGVKQTLYLPVVNANEKA